jgi:exodeoxyribonuclease VII small subunit
LEEGDVDLENLVAEYQKGSELLKFCKSKVEKAEIKIKEIEGRTNIIEGDDHVL